MLMSELERASRPRKSRSHRQEFCPPDVEPYVGEDILDPDEDHLSDVDQLRRYASELGNDCEEYKELPDRAQGH
jgi:hypothetical protein